jgi:iron complex outermembrane receptor protein
MPKMSEMRSAIVVAVVGIAAAGLWTCSAAHAQSAAGATAGTASQSSEPDTNLNEIVVTALRRSERIQDVPIAINVVSEAQLNDSQVTSVRDLGQLVPGLKFSASVQAFPTIRGVYSEQSDPGNDPNVSIYVDGVYQANPIADNFDLVDIDHIEVLKGPQGTLFGRNATGGAIRIFTTDPSFTPTGLADVSYGRFNDVAVHTYYAGPVVGDVVAASLAVNYETSDGYTTTS